MLDNDIPDPSCLVCEVDVVPAMAHTCPDDGGPPPPIWPDGVDDDSGTLHDSVDVIAVCDIHNKYGNVREVRILAYESPEL